MYLCSWGEHWDPLGSTLSPLKADLFRPHARAGLAKSTSRISCSQDNIMDCAQDSLKPLIALLTAHQWCQRRFSKASSLPQCTRAHIPALKMWGQSTPPTMKSKDPETDHIRTLHPVLHPNTCSEHKWKSGRQKWKVYQGKSEIPGKPQGFYWGVQFQFSIKFTGLDHCSTMVRDCDFPGSVRLPPPLGTNKWEELMRSRLIQVGRNTQSASQKD